MEWVTRLLRQGDAKVFKKYAQNRDKNHQFTFSRGRTIFRPIWAVATFSVISRSGLKSK